jgi:hypothetical protein
LLDYSCKTLLDSKGSSTTQFGDLDDYEIVDLTADSPSMPSMTPRSVNSSGIPAATSKTTSTGTRLEATRKRHRSKRQLTLSPLYSEFEPEENNLTPNDNQDLLVSSSLSKRRQQEINRKYEQKLAELEFEFEKRKLELQKAQEEEGQIIT